ncbi:MAG: hypothetical protein WAU45_18240 [Blastocatellia bacterium]
MRKSMIIMVSFTLVIAALAFGLMSSNRQCQDLQQRKKVDLSSAVVVVAASERAVAEAITGLFQEKKGSTLGRFDQFYLVSANDQTFPDDLQMRAHSSLDQSLQRYLALEPRLRKSDYYLYEPTGDYYWDSEYYCNDSPAKFRCSFIIHLESDRNVNTKIEIFEYLPVVWVGKKFDVAGHHGPGFYNDTREVEPTGEDRVELLDVLKKAIDGSTANR